jgi:hypothetical protein
VSVALIGGLLGVACSADLEVVGTPESPSSSSTSTAPTATATGDASTAPEKDAAVADAAKPLPSAPFFEVSVNGTPLVVKSVSAKATKVQQGMGTWYYDITAVLEQTPAIVPGLQDAPSITIRVGKDDTGTAVCREVYGPIQGAVLPVTQIRQVQIKYRRFTGSSTVSAFPNTTREGACDMVLERPSTGGQAWGEAKGSVQAGSDEPKLSFDVKWFQNVSWE